MRTIATLLIAIATLVSQPTSASAYTVNGQYFVQISCRYQYNTDFGAAGYVGTYRGPSGAVYSWFFPTSQYSWCPY